MLKNIATAFAMVGLLGFTACAAEEEPAVIDEPVVEQPATAPVVEPAPINEDTAGMGADQMMMDTTGL